MSREVTSYVEDKQKTFTRYKTTGLESGLDQYSGRVKKITRRAKRECEKDMANNIKQNRKAFLWFIRGKEQVKTNVRPLRDSTGRLVCD